MQSWTRTVGRRGGFLAAALFAVVGTTAVPAAAQPATGRTDAPRVIRVTGTGEARATPDRAHIDLSVETFAASAREAGEQNARVMDAVIRALTGAGVSREAIQTRGYSLFPEYERPDRPPVPRAQDEPAQPRIVGYRAMNMVTVRTSELARVGQLIDVALGAGANRMDALRFSLSDPEAAQNQALRQASERARRSAEAMAAALGVRLGEVVEATTLTDMIGPVIQMEAAMVRAAMAPPTPVEPGEQTVAARVTVAFSIEGG